MSGKQALVRDLHAALDSMADPTPQHASQLFRRCLEALSAQPAEPKQPEFWDDEGPAPQADLLVEIDMAKDCQLRPEYFHELLQKCRDYISEHPAAPPAAEPKQPVAWKRRAAELLREPYRMKSNKLQREAFEYAHKLDLEAAPPAAEPKKQTEDSLPASVGGAAAPRR